jgi:hypothetical protein
MSQRLIKNFIVEHSETDIDSQTEDFAITLQLGKKCFDSATSTYEFPATDSTIKFKITVTREPIEVSQPKIENSTSLLKRKSVIKTETTPVICIDIDDDDDEEPAANLASKMEEKIVSLIDIKSNLDETVRLNNDINTSQLQQFAIIPLVVLPPEVENEIGSEAVADQGESEITLETKKRKRSASVMQNDEPAFAEGNRNTKIDDSKDFVLLLSQPPLSKRQKLEEIEASQENKMVEETSTKTSRETQENAHQVQHSPEKMAIIKKFECDIDGKCFKTKAKIRQHMEAAHLNAFCKLCNKEVRLAYKNKHLRTVHSISEVRYSHLENFNEKYQTILICDLCECTFRNETSYQRHMAVQHKSSKFKCSHCDFECNLSKDFINHLNSHIG